MRQHCCMNCGCSCDERLETLAANMAEALQAWLGSTHDQWVHSPDGRLIGESLDEYRQWKRETS